MMTQLFHLIFGNSFRILSVVFKLDLANKGKSLIYFGLLLISIAAEVFSVLLVLPVINVINQKIGEDIISNFIINLDFVFNWSDSDKVISVLVIVFLAIIFKNSYLAYFTFYQYNFFISVQEKLSSTLLSIYSHQPYIFHLKKDSSTLIRNIIDETSLFRTHAITPLFSFFAEALVFVGIVGILLFQEPMITLVIISLIFTLFYLFNFFTRVRLLRWGQERQVVEKDRLKSAQEIFLGIKDLIIYNKISEFTRKYRRFNQRSLRIARNLIYIGVLPKLILETLAILAVVTAIILMIASGNELKSILSLLGLFAASSYRLFPSINSLAASYQNLVTSSSLVNSVEADLNLNLNGSEIVSGQISFKQELQLSKIFFQYPESDKAALRNISFKIKKGEMIGIVGRSGSGKSTLVDLLLGLFSAQSGEILCDGKVVNDFSSWRRLIGYVPQSIFLTDDTIKNNITLSPDLDSNRVEALKRSIEQAQLINVLSDLPDGIDTIIGERGVRLSGGQRQRIGIARALFNDPEILILDEATSALDTATEMDFVNSIEGLHKSKTIIIIAHRLTTVRNCDRIYEIDDGKIVRIGKPSEILNLAENIKN